MNPVLSIGFASFLGFCAGGCDSSEGVKAAETARVTPAPPARVAVAATPPPEAVALTKVNAAPERRAPTAPGRRTPIVVKLDRPPTAEEARIARMALARVFHQAAEDTGEANIDYSVAMTDLNDDNRPDLIVHIDDYRVCGQWGCQGYAILATPTGFSRQAIQLGTCFQVGFTVLPTATRGMRDLKFTWGGEADRGSVISKWNGRTYDGGCLDLE